MRLLSSLKAATPLVLNGYALVANVGVSSVLGIVFWMIATRLYTQEQVGFAAALISLMMTTSFLAQMNMGALLTRFLPLAGGGAGRLILKTYAGAGLFAALVGTGFALAAGSFAEPLLVVRTSPVATMIFVGATIAWTVFSLKDAALSGLRRSTLVPVENAAYSVLKIVVLVLVAQLALPKTGGIFLAFVLPLIPLILIINAAIFARLPARATTPVGQLPDLKTVFRFLGWDFLGSLGLSAAYGLAPFWVTAFAGVASTATYHLAWSMAYSIHLVGMAMSVSLIAEGVTDPLRLRRLIVDTLCHALILSVLAVVVIAAGAPLLMGMFGKSYVAEGAPVLRILALSCLPWTISTIYFASARIKGDTRAVALVQISTLLVFAATGAILVAGLGALGVALAWLVAHGVTCAAVVVSVMRRDGPGTLANWTIALAHSAMQLLRSVWKMLRGGSRINRRIAQDLVSPGDFHCPDCSKLTVLDGSTNCVTAVLLENDGPAGGPVGVLKFGTSPRGRAYVSRNAEALRSLVADTRLASHWDLIPRILAEDTTSGHIHTVETAIVGFDGLQLDFGRSDALLAMAVASSTVAEMHRKTATRSRLDDRWAENWIDAPAAIVREATGNLGNWRQREIGIERLCADLRAACVGRWANLGLGHGDLSFGNLFFSDRDITSRDLRVAGLIDWEAYRPDALAQLDASHLGLTVRMARTGEEIGPVVRDFLQSDGWTLEEIAVFRTAGVRDDNDPLDDKAIVVLVWLRHVATIVRNTEPSLKSRLWLAWNVDRVLDTVARIRFAAHP